MLGFVSRWIDLTLEWGLLHDVGVCLEIWGSISKPILSHGGSSRAPQIDPRRSTGCLRRLCLKACTHSWGTCGWAGHTTHSTSHPFPAPAGCPLWWGKTLCNRYWILAGFIWNGTVYFCLFKMWWDVAKGRAWTLVETSPCLRKPQPQPVRGVLQQMEWKSIVPAVTGAVIPF